MRQSQRQWLAGWLEAGLRESRWSSVTRRPKILPRPGTTGPTEPAHMTTVRHRSGTGLGLHLGTYSELMLLAAALGLYDSHVFKPDKSWGHHAREDQRDKSRDSLTY